MSNPYDLSQRTHPVTASRTFVIEQNRRRQLEDVLIKLKEVCDRLDEIDRRLASKEEQENE